RRRQAVEILRALVDSDRSEEITSSLHALIHLPAEEAKRVAALANQALDVERRQELAQALAALRHRSTSPMLAEVSQILAVAPVRMTSSSGIPTLRGAAEAREDRKLASLGLDVLRAWETARCRLPAFEELVTEILAAEDNIGQGVLVAEAIHRRQHLLLKLGKRAIDLADADALDAPFLRK